MELLAPVTGAVQDAPSTSNDYSPAPDVSGRHLPTDLASTRSPDAVPLLEARGSRAAGQAGPPVLTGIDLRLDAGSSVAIVGPSGLGKTTLLLTLAGLLPPQAGQVLLAGHRADEVTRAQAAAAVTMTAEDAHVFDTTVLENLRVARSDVTADEARSTLAAVGLAGWVSGLPDGLDAVLGSDAARISGGERRRLLVARALLSPAPVLLLDEPTEHVDAEGLPCCRACSTDHSPRARPSSSSRTDSPGSTRRHG